MSRRGIHNGRPETSPRLLRVLQLLADGREHTTLEIQQRGRTVAPSASVSELRACGYRIECERRSRSADRGPVWVYWMPSPPTPIEMARLGA